MISQVTFWVEHGETTDPLQGFLDLAQGLEDTDDHGFRITETDFIVDVTPPKVKDDIDAIITMLDERPNFR